MGIREDDDDLPDEFMDDLIEHLKRIPDFTDRGVYHYGTCTCGGKITAIRSTYNGHLHAECDKCGFKMME